MKRIKVQADIIITITDDRTDITGTVLGVELALNGHYQNALQPEGITTRPEHIENPDKVGLRFHFHGMEEKKDDKET